MRPVAKSFPGATGGTVKPKPASEMLSELGRIFSGLLAALVLTFFLVPSEAQAHGMHGSLGMTAQIGVPEESSAAVTLGGAEPSALICITCCASSGCIAVSVPEPFTLPGAGAPNSSIQVASTIELCQMAQHGVRRPPKQNL